MDVGLGFGIWDSKVTGMWGYISSGWTWELEISKFFLLKFETDPDQDPYPCKDPDSRWYLSRSLKNFPSRRGKSPMSAGHDL